jgi:hypothetical protein
MRGPSPDGAILGEEKNMAIIDSQVHVYEADRPERPWVAKITGPAHVTGDEQVAAMDGWESMAPSSSRHTQPTVTTAAMRRRSTPGILAGSRW